MGQHRRQVGRQRTGRRGEELAARWYLKQGYEVLDRNWRVRDGEIDLICGRDSLVVFCEVKARASSRYGSGWEAVDRRKRQRIRAVAACWLTEVGPGGVDVRFDVATVDARGHVEVLEGCF